MIAQILEPIEAVSEQRLGRKFYKRVGVENVYQGPKSVNVVVSKEQALELAIGIIWACRESKAIDLTFYITKRQKRTGGKIPQNAIVSTVTSAA